MSKYHIHKSTDIHTLGATGLLRDLDFATDHCIYLAMNATNECEKNVEIEVTQ